VNLGEFLFPNSTLNARYGSWSGTNINTDADSLDSFDNPVGDTATNISDGDEDNGLTQSVSGYGGYTSDDGVDTTAASAFRIAYTVRF
jgi:hypothetical protein